jgi:hypothetical protein
MPADLTSTLTIDAWIAAVLTPLKGQVVEKTAISAKVIIPGDPAAERFPLKLRDEAINLGFSMLRTKSKALLMTIFLVVLLREEQTWSLRKTRTKTGTWEP